ncbi:MAG: GldG family protein [candidate division KSB1 bacterium]|nr:GldG family protein [candidate division KSB1 bacterium]MDZ7303486.1 GldG family protein [candidate division KSB1 bacterium]MDZ7312712.1 GldG family protein [candidate division KSB1 bacterium]
MKKYSPYAGILGLILIVTGLLIHYVRAVWKWQELVPLAIGGVLLVIYVIFNFKAIIDFITHRGALQTANAVLMCILVLGLLGFVNYLASKHAWRKDTTAARQFSLSDQTRKVLKSLKEDLRVTAFYQAQEQHRIADQLNEYASVTPKFKHEFIDPDKRPDLARRYGVTAYNTTVFSYRGQDEKITTATEEDMTNAIIKVTREKKKKIYFTTNHGEKTISNEERLGMSVAQKVIKDKNYEVATLSLIDTTGIPPDCSVLVVAGAQTPFLPPEMDKVKNYLQKGGAALFLLEPDPAPSFNEILADYGIQGDKNFIVDFSGIGQLFGAGPDMPVVASYSRHTITEKFGNFMTAFPSARSLTVMNEKPTGVTVEAFASTSVNSWGETSAEELRARQVKPDPVDRRGPLPIGVAATKSVSSTGSSTGGSQNSRLVVFGDSDFSANYLFGFQKNGDLFMNALSWLAEEEDLIAIPPKNPEDRRISLTASGSRVILLVSLILLPLAAFATAIGVYRRRR